MKTATTRRSSLCLLAATSALLATSFLISAPSVQGQGQKSPPARTVAAEAARILSPESAGSLQFDSATYSVSEAGSFVTITVTRTGDNSGEVTVDYSTADGSAISVEDYSSKSGTLTWADGDMTDKTFTVGMLDDAVFEGDEDFSVTLTNATGNATIGSPDTATVTIEDDESQPTLSIADVTVDESDGSAFFTVTLSGESTFDVTFDYATSNGTAVEPGDYQNTSGTGVTISAGNTSTTLSVQIFDDFINENDEDFTVDLSNPSNATIDFGTATGQITDNDSEPTYTIDDVTSEEGDLGTTNFVFTVTKVGETKFASSIQFNTSDGSAVAGEDYVATSGTLNFDAGETEETITVQVNGDGLEELNEDFFVQLFGASGGRQGEGFIVDTGTGTITNDDTVPVADPVTTSTDENVPVTITLSANDADGDELTFIVLKNPSNGTLGTVSTPNCVSGSCTATVDYTPNDGFDGPDSFAYKANDGTNDSNEAGVSITVNATVPVVTNTNDSGPGSLRQALADSEDGETITFDFPPVAPDAPHGTAFIITLTSGELLIDKEVFINGLGAHILTVRRDPNAQPFRIFRVSTNESPWDGSASPSSVGGVTIQGMTISDGLVQGAYPDGFGGGIYNEGSALAVTACALIANSADGFGGGILSDGGLSGVAASLLVSNSTFSENSAFGGGAMANYAAFAVSTATVANCTFSGNSAAQGGAIANEAEGGFGAASLIRLTNSTFGGNSAASLGGAIYNVAFDAGDEATIDIGNTILDAGDNGGTITNRGPGATVNTLGFNLASDGGVTNLDGATGSLNHAADQVNTDPILGPLKDNGGPTETYAPLTNSPAIDGGKDIDATGEDQRGSTRPVTSNNSAIVPPPDGDRSDIGAVELPAELPFGGASSIKNHGDQGNFSVQLASMGPVTTEPRSGGAAMAHTIEIFLFGEVTFSEAVITRGVGTIDSVTKSRAGELPFPFTIVTVELSGVANAQRLTLALLDVGDGPGPSGEGDFGIRIGYVRGDITNDGAVNASDISSVKAVSGQTTEGGNFRNDVNVNGVITASDIGMVKAQSGINLPPGPLAPVIRPGTTLSTLRGTGKQ
jgi:hypothetical protein